MFAQIFLPNAKWVWNGQTIEQQSFRKLQLEDVCHQRRIKTPEPLHSSVCFAVETRLIKAALQPHLQCHPRRPAGGQGAPFRLGGFASAAPLLFFMFFFVLGLSEKA